MRAAMWQTAPVVAVAKTSSAARKASLFGAFLSLAATLTCWKKLPT